MIRYSDGSVCFPSGPTSVTTALRTVETILPHSGAVEGAALERPHPAGERLLTEGARRLTQTDGLRHGNRRAPRAGTEDHLPGSPRAKTVTWDTTPSPLIPIITMKTQYLEQALTSADLYPMNLAWAAHPTGSIMEHMHLVQAGRPTDTMTEDFAGLSLDPTLLSTGATSRSIPNP